MPVEVRYTLAEEMHFIKAYFYLLKTRHRDGIFLETTLENQHLTYLIPPLTLQILFENAIKHNVIFVNRPLTIKVYVRDGNLYVENDLQKKKIAVQSNHIGLQNIMMKYKLLDHSLVTVYHDDEKFLVGIPLIKPTIEVLSV
jgi:two-component system LytT family sensor kinase